MKQWRRIAGALGLAVAVGGAAGVFYLFRDRVIDVGPARAHGAFRTEQNTPLFAAASAYAEKKIKQPGQACVSHWLGTDDRYVYLAFGCARFRRQYGQVRAYGDQGFRAVRIRRWWGTRVFGLDQVNTDRFYASLRELFPPPAVAEWWKHSSFREFLAAGAGTVTAE
jgi:hypothetical protein